MWLLSGKKGESPFLIRLQMTKNISAIGLKISIMPYELGKPLHL